MSIVVYSARGSLKGMEKSHTVWDETLAFPGKLLSYQAGEYVIVVFEDPGNNVSGLLKPLRMNFPFGDHLLHSLQGPFSFLVYNRTTKKLEAFRSLTADPLYYCHSCDGLFVSDDLQSLTRFGKDLNEDYFRLYLHTELIETEYTPYKSVKRLLPGYKMTKTKDSGITIKNSGQYLRQNGRMKA